jgi:ABC-type Na+ transport system ATPase subunit NatA
MIEARNLVKRYGSTMAVNDLSFSIRPGMVTGFLGPNGAGKPNLGLRHFFAAAYRLPGCTTVTGGSGAVLARGQRQTTRTVACQLAGR